MRWMRTFTTALMAVALASPALAVPVGQGENGDWAYLARYRGANQALSGKPDPRRVVFMGDSITEGWAKESFIDGNRHFVGRGISGQTTTQMLVRFRSDVIALKPAVVHIMAGTNDIAENNGPESEDEMFGAIVSMIELARANRIKVVLASVPPAKDFPWHQGLNPAPKIRSLNAWLKDYAASHGLVYADYWSALATSEGGMKPQYAEDGVHPTPAGYAAMRPIAEAAIAKALRRR
jgi:lysophospholipase L1-like esterase